MHELLELATRHGLSVVFLATLAARLGAPVPASAVLVVAGGLIAAGELSLAAVLAVGVLANAPALRDYHLLPSVRGDLLATLGRHAVARGEFERAAALARNEREAECLRRRAAALATD